MDILKEIVWHSFLWLLWGGSLVAILTGAGLLAFPAGVERLNKFLARWIDTEAVQTGFDRPRWAERYVYRHHRIFGPLLFLGSIFVLYKFLFFPIKARVALLLTNDVFRLFDAAAAFFIIVSVLGAVIGLTVTFRPSMLREFEDIANRWISTDYILRFFNEPRFTLDAHAFAHRKVTAVFLILGGIYVALLLGKVLFAGQWQL
jgi:hypothetical protein